MMVGNKTMDKSTYKAVMVALTVMWVSSCLVVEENSGGGEPVIVASCDSDSACAEGLVCDETVHMCMADEDLEMTGWVRLVPPSEGMVAVEEQYPGVEVSNGESLNLTLHRPIRVSGNVYHVGDPMFESAEAEIVAVAQGEIPGLLVQQKAKAEEVKTSSDGVGTEGGFEFLVIPDKTYDIYVRLSGPEYSEGTTPPYHVRRSFSLQPGSPDPYSYAWDIEIPPQDGYLKLTGRLVCSGSSGETPIEGAKVYGLAQASGNLTSTDLTDAKGSFELWAQPPKELDYEVYELRIRPSQHNELVPEKAVKEVEMSQSMDVGTIVTSGLDKLVPLRLEVTNAPDDFDLELSGTSVRFSGKVDKGSLTVERLLDQDRSVELVLPQGSYVMSVVPPVSSSYGIYQQLVQLVYPSDDTVDILVELSPKVSLHGFVQDHSGNRVEGAQLTAVFTGKGVFPDTSPLPYRSYDVFTNDQGDYEVLLDPGQYSIVIDPPAQLGLPRKLERNIFVSGSQQRSWEFALPVVVTGQVYGQVTADLETDEAGSSGAPIPATVGPAAEVRVELYDEVDGERTPDGVAPIPIAETWTDEEGHFFLLLPIP